MQTVVDNLLTNYSTMGSGPALLLLHGWGDDSRTFQALQAELSSKYRVLSLDLPGFGKTQAPPDVWDLDNYANFVQKFLSKLEITEVHAIIGHSNGGALAIRGLSLGLLKSTKLVLLAASGIRTGQTVKRIAIKVVARVGKFATLWLPISIKRKLRKKLYGVAGSDLLVAPHLEETFKRTVRQDIQEDAMAIKQQTLLVYAANDPAVPLADGKKLAQLIQNSKLVELQAGGHFVHHDAADQVYSALKEFLAQ